MKRFFIAAAATLIFSLPAIAQPAPAAPAAAPAGFSVATSTIGDLLDHPAAKAVFAKYLPDVVSNPQLDQGRGMTLPEIVQYVPDLTPEKLAAIDADLKALSPE
jgi:para-nitrobenzyl esterase